MAEIGGVTEKPVSISQSAPNQGGAKIDPKKVEETFGTIVNIQSPQKKGAVV